jgi:hypothetical protein
MASQEELEAKILALEGHLQNLELRLESERSQRRRLMRDTHQCPACGQQKIFFVSQLETYVAGDTGALRVATKSIWTGKPIGVVHAHVCANCGHAEFQINDPAAIEGKKNVQVLAPPPPDQEPYR